MTIDDAIVSLTKELPPHFSVGRFSETADIVSISHGARHLDFNLSEIQHHGVVYFVRIATGVLA